MTPRRVVIVVAIALACVLAWWLWPVKSPGVPDPLAPSATPRDPIAERARNLRERKRIDPHAQRRGSIAGRVTRREGGGVAGARVCGSAWSRDLASDDLADFACTTTSADGAYQLADLLPASYWLSASAPRFIPASYRDPAAGRSADSSRVVLVAAEDRTGIDIVLAPGGVEVRGIVRDIGGGPISSAQVVLGDSGRLTAAGWAIARSADDGTFTAWVAPGTVIARARAPGYAEGTRYAVAPGERIEILLTPESVLAGKVVEAGTDRPVAGARVTVEQRWDGTGGSSSPTAITDDRGEFRISRLEPGRYKPEATVAGGWGKARQSVLLGLGQTVEGVVIELHQVAVITGTIRVAGSGEPCRSGWVWFRSADQSRYLSGWTEHRDGRVEIPAVPPGTYKLHVSCEGYLDRDDFPELVVAGDDIVDQVWEVASGGALRGKVTGADGAPLAAVSVSAELVGGDPRGQRSDGSAQTETDGSYEIAGLVAGHYRVEVDSDDLLESQKPPEVDIPAGGDATLDIALATGGIVEGEVVDADGAPVGGAMVSLRGERRGTESARTRDDGGFQMRGIRAGSYRVIAMREWWGAELRRPGSTDDDLQGAQVRVVDGQVARVKIIVESQSGSIHGRVVDAAGAPVTDAYVSAERESDAAGTSRSAASRSMRWQWLVQPAVTDMDGRFSVGKLSPGTYTVQAHRRGGGEAIAEQVAAGSQVTLTIRDVASIAGTVAVAGGSPPDELTISVSDRKTGFERDEQFFRTGGQWMMEDLPAGTFSISATSAVGDGGVTQVMLAAGQRMTGVRIELAARATLTGRVVALDTGEPVSGMQIYAWPVGGSGGGSWGGDQSDKQWITGADGRFRIDHVAAGRAQVFASPLDRDGSPFAFAAVVVQAAPGTTTDVGTIKVPRRRIERRARPGDLGYTLVDSEPDVDPAAVRLEVALVRAGGPAEAGGLRAGDVIVSVDGNDVRGIGSYLYYALTRVAAGDKVVLGLARGDTVDITAGAPR